MADARGLDRLAAARRDAHRRPRRRVLRLRHGDHLPRLPRRLRGGHATRTRPRRRRRSARCRTSPSGDAVQALELEPEGHATTPPARYTEASLVQALEERGIGRPSTYAVDHGHDPRPRLRLQARARRSFPSFLAFAVVTLLEQHFAQLVDYELHGPDGGRSRPDRRRRRAAARLAPCASTTARMATAG